ncbi:nucleotidyltransferase substrate binding protein [Synechococcus sp. UW140]|uniref:nucleotidyltransferase substrate binding protein n=1 Tax=Synechococcus sp. UW140 TaxID=368503 RepID=UPI003137C78F
MTSSSDERHDIRWIQRFDNFKRAFARLSEASELADQRDLSDLERQGLIQAFEFTHELAWNTFKDFLSARGSSQKLYGSKDATRAAFAAELIENGEAWMEMIKHRNESSHTYNNDVAVKIMEAVLTLYVPAFEAFQRRFLELEKEDSA